MQPCARAELPRKERNNMKEHMQKRETKKPKKLAAGGVGKLRHKQMTAEGAPLSKAEFKKKRI